MDPNDIHMLSAAGEALLIILDPMRLAILSFAALLGVILGILPGIGGLAGTALLLPFAFAMDPYTAFAFLLGLGSTTSTGDPIPAILFGVPGGSGSQATVLDGLPMARRGEAGRALSAAYMSSLMGGIFGAALMGFAIPVLRPLVLSIGSPEMASLAILGLSMVAAISGNAPLKGLAAACIGVMIAMIGTDPMSGAFRWTFDRMYLWDGMPLVPISLGLFALPELCDLMISRSAISETARSSAKSGLLQGARDSFKSWWLVLRCSWIGAMLGAMPGVGPAVVDWMAYGHAIRTEKDAKESFGKGDVRGVIAAESANNAREGGALLVTVAFGIPGSASMAILLGAFIAHGLLPGPDMLGKNLAITYSMVWSIAVANIVGAGLCYAFSGQFAKVATLRYTLILPCILSIIYVGAFSGSRDWGDLYALLFFGVFGWVMKRLRWPRPPLILGVVLGATIERFMFISIRLQGWSWLANPVVMLFFAIAIWGIFGPMIRRKLKGEPLFDEGKLRLRMPRFGLPDLFPVFLLGGIGYLFFLTLTWPSTSAIVPRVVSGVALLVILASLLQSGWQRVPSDPSAPAKTRHRGIHMDTESEMGDMTLAQVLLRAGMFFGWLVAFMASMATIGLIPTILPFVVLFMRIEGREPWRIVLPMAFGTMFAVYYLFDQLLALPWPPTLVGRMLPALAEWIPSM